MAEASEAGDLYHTLPFGIWNESVIIPSLELW
jgi:hypothetical protein